MRKDKEVYIDKQRVDIEQTSEAGYLFESPIFRDISKILSNRTTTYKIPKTARNVLLFGFANDPEALSEFQYQEHDFEEWRNGLLFIRGKCQLLNYKSEYFEFSVIWGNTINLLSLKDKNLRDYSLSDFLSWDSTSKLVTPNDDHEGRGFILTDFGKGVFDSEGKANMQYIHPSVTIRYILDHIEKGSGVKFEYHRFEEIFRNRWIPLTEKNANVNNWNEHRANLVTDSFFIYDFLRGSFIKVSVKNGDASLIGGDAYTTFKLRGGGPMRISLNIIIRDINISSTNDNYKLMVRAISGTTLRFTTYFTKFFPITRDQNGLQRVSIEIDELIESNNNADVLLLFSVESNEGSLYPFSGGTIYDVYNANFVREEAKEIVFGDKFYIAANLPDMKAIDFLKSLMQMYGLFTYYNFRNDNVVEFISIDDMYSYKANAYDWTNKLVTTNRGRFNVSSKYGDYARNNIVDYDNDDNVINNKTSGSIVINDATLLPTKELFTLPYSASDNYADDYGTYAVIPLYDKDGELQKVTTRILTGGEYKVNGVDYVSAYFNNNQKFSGNEGLLKKYYKDYQSVLTRPVIVEFYVVFSEMDLFKYREVYPIYIDGTYYMPISLTVQDDNACICKAIKLPPKD